MIGRLPDAGSVECLHRTIEDWFIENGRVFPWRQTSNSYHILVAEVLLRRTQAYRVVEPYLQLIELYPDVRAMLEADISWLRD